MSQSAFALDRATEHQDRIARSIEATRKLVTEDVSLRPPRTEEERANGFVAWIEKYHAKYLPEIEAIVRQEFVGTALTSEPDRLREITDCQVWPEVQFLLVGTYALKY